MSAVPLVALVFLTRSRLVAIGCAVATLLSLIRNPLDEIWFWWIVDGMALTMSWALWYAAILIPLYVWAIRQRRMQRPAWMCAACGYDLRGSRGNTCPECGHARPMGVAEALRRLCR